MTMREMRSIAIAPLARALAGVLILAAAPAYAQSANSSRATGVTGSFSGPEASVDPAAENVNCNGDVQLTTRAVNDANRPPGVVVTIDATGLACAGQATRGRYVTDTQETLTRLLVATDVIQTTLAFHRDTPNGFLTARTALLTLNLTYDTTTGALTGATGTLGNFVAP